jgi:Sugar phosphate permease
MSIKNSTQDRNTKLESRNAKSNFGKWGWIFILFHINAYFFQTGMAYDGQNIVAPAIAKLLDIPYGNVLAVATPCALIALLGYLAMGKLSQKISSSKIFGSCMILIGISYIVMCNAKSLIIYAIGLCCTIIFANGAAYVAGGQIVAAWFPKKRDLVCGYSTMGCNLSSALYIPLLAAAVVAFGLGKGSLLFAGCSIVLGILSLIILRDTPKERGILPDNVSPEVFKKEYAEVREVKIEEHYWTASKLFKSPIFWLAGLTVGVNMMATSGIMSQLVVRNMELGLTQAESVALMSVIACIGVFGSWAWGIISQKIGTVPSIRLYLVWYMCGIVANLTGTRAGLYISVFIIGVSIGAAANFVIALPTSIWGSAEFKFVWPYFYFLYSSCTAWYGLVNGTAVNLAGSLKAAYIFFLVLLIINLFITKFIKDGMYNPDYQKETEALDSKKDN